MLIGIWSQKTGLVGGLTGGLTGGQKRQLDAVTGLLGGATGTDSAAGASSSGAAGPLDAVVSDARTIMSSSNDGLELENFGRNTDLWP